MEDTRYVTDGSEPPGRYVLYSLCECSACNLTGRVGDSRCRECRGEGRVRQEIASATDPQSLGVALITLAREGTWGNGCPLGLLDREGETGQKWLILPWQPSPRNVSDAARVLAKSKTKEKT